MAAQLSLFGSPQDLSGGAVKTKKELDKAPAGPGSRRKWPRNLGMPYMGSKSRMVRKWLHLIPSAPAFVDLFAGGCAVTHAALLDGRWPRIVANDVAGTPAAFLYAVRGGARVLASRWVSREDFAALKGHNDAESILLRLVWSFGYVGRSYLFSREREPLKKELHAVLTGKTLRERRLAWRAFAGVASRAGLRLQSLESLERLERLERLESLGSLERLELHALDYQAVPIPPGAVIYADPPYRNTEGYANGVADEAFHDKFFAWARAQTAPVFISEYEAPPDFACIWTAERVGHLSASNNAHRVTECLFANAAALKAMERAQ